ncbi:MAG TPA: hypothetical protein DDY49_04035, partial [Paenibacillaceae bacterium]|nr:hypothetical protein [Paenibacillaceae bacterium]
QINTPNQDEISFKYDSVGRNTEIYLNGDKQYSYGYDVKGNLLSAKDEFLNLTWSATYNDLNQITS